MNRSPALALLCVVAAAGCQRVTQLPTSTSVRHSAPQTLSTNVDRSTPDRTVKSYWLLTEETEAVSDRVFRCGRDAPEMKAATAALNNLFAGDALLVKQKWDADEPSRETFHREIVSVIQETPSRAIVVARIRNTSKIPEGAVVTQTEAEARRDGSLVRYILERDDAGWKIVQAQEPDAMHQGEWRNYYNPQETYVSTWVHP